MNEVSNNVEGSSEQTNTVLFELPASIPVVGPRGLKGTLDMTKATNAAVIGAINRWVRITCMNASAQVDGFDEKVKAEIAMMRRLEVFDWSPGSGGKGGSRITDETQAHRNVLTRYFIAQGCNKTDAKKRANVDHVDAWLDLTRMALARKLNRSDITIEEVEHELLEQTDVIKELIKNEILAIMAEKTRKANLDGAAKALFG